MSVRQILRFKKKLGTAILRSSAQVALTSKVLTAKLSAMLG
jgi:hypothetical protein